MYNVAIHAPWASDDHIFKVWSRYLPANNEWGNIRLVHRSEPHHYLIIFNYPTISFDPNKTFLYQHEPTPLRTTWPSPFNNPPDNCMVGCHTIEKLYMPYHWYELYDKDWEWLTTNEVKKTKEISAVISEKLLFEGSRDRIAFLHDWMEKISPVVHHFGNCTKTTIKCQLMGRTEDKSEALLPYKYTIACENSYEKNYFTEKITDAVVSECLTFYSGCPNIDEFFDPKCYIKINLKDPHSAVQTINEAMSMYTWEDRLPYIKAEKQKILHEKHFFAMLERHINELHR